MTFNRLWLSRGEKNEAESKKRRQNRKKEEEKGNGFARLDEQLKSKRKKELLGPSHPRFAHGQR